MLRYVVAATPRTGSSLLCEGLWATQRAGRPAEPFAPMVEEAWRNRLNLASAAPYSDFFDAAVRYGTRRGVHGLKIQWMHVAELGSKLGLDQRADVLATLFPEARFVNIVRRDRAAQAISWLRAIRTNEWWRLTEPARAPDPGAFDAAAIAGLEREIAIQQAAWENYFKRRAIASLVVEYEALTADYAGEVQRVLHFLNLDSGLAPTLPAPRLRRQADRLSEEWRHSVQRAAVCGGMAQ